MKTKSIWRCSRRQRVDPSICTNQTRDHWNWAEMRFPVQVNIVVKNALLQTEIFRFWTHKLPVHSSWKTSVTDTNKAAGFCPRHTQKCSYEIWGLSHGTHFQCFAWNIHFLLNAELGCTDTRDHTACKTHSWMRLQAKCQTQIIWSPDEISTDCAVNLYFWCLRNLPASVEMTIILGNRWLPDSAFLLCLKEECNRGFLWILLSWDESTNSN